MEYKALTDVGMKRLNNEDSYVVNIDNKEKIFIVADGMGGHNAGEIASMEACRIVEAHILEKKGDIKEIMREAVVKANRDIFIRAAENSNLNGMGTTIEACVLKGRKLYAAHVGDSRIYIISNGEMRKITKDHSVVGMMIDAGTITEEEAQFHPQRHYITRAVGTSMTIDVDIIEEEVHGNDIVLMCTDGLTNMIDKNTMLDIVSNSSSLDKAAEELVKKAKENGGDDNITVILLRA